MLSISKETDLCYVFVLRNTSIIIRLEARRHSPYNGTQKTVCETEITYLRVDGDGEAIPISDKVKEKYKDRSSSTPLKDTG